MFTSSMTLTETKVLHMYKEGHEHLKGMYKKKICWQSLTHTHTHTGEGGLKGRRQVKCSPENREI